MKHGIAKNAEEKELGRASPLTIIRRKCKQTLAKVRVSRT